MMNTKTAHSNGVSPATAGAIGQMAPSKYIQTIVSLPVPPEVQAAARAQSTTTEVSVSDSDVLLETDPGTTESEPPREARAVASQEPTDPGVLQRQRRVRRIAMAACGGLAIFATAIAIAIVSRGALHRGSAAASASASHGTPAASAPAVASSSPPAAAPAASEASVANVATVATVDPATAPPSAQSPRASAPAKTPAPRAHPGRPKHAPTKTVR
jgi:hypothetical protein